MFKRFGLLALMIGGTGAALLPAAAQAQDRYGYYRGDQGYYVRHDRDCDRHERREWRERRDHERRAERRYYR